MPISDVDGYEIGHFKRVYEYIIKPACEKAGFIAIRADDVQKMNMIAIDVIRKIIQSEMAICDLSARNPNVFYELGIRQSFDLPVVLIKDEITSRAFDIQGFRDIEYSPLLRVDEVQKAIDSIAKSLKETFFSKGEDVNSIIELLGINKAQLKEPVEISSDTELILQAITDVNERLNRFEKSINPIASSVNNYSQKILSEGTESFPDLNGKAVYVGDSVDHVKFGKGQVTHIKHSGSDKQVIIKFNSGVKTLLASFAKLVLNDEDLPF
jgi:hypothetical protein